MEGWKLSLLRCGALPSRLLQVVCGDLRVGRRLKVTARI